MLVIISDLHLTDRSTSRIRRGDGKSTSLKAGCKYSEEKEDMDLSNVSSSAFRLYFDHISNIIHRRKKISDLTFVYNGDIFDPLRSEAWFSADRKSSPWQKPYSPEDELKKFHSIMECIVETQQESLKWLSCTHPELPENIMKLKPKLAYLPGNHDRTVNLYQPTRALVYDKLLGKPGNQGKQKFKNYILDGRHETIVMHGNEADNLNCEYGDKGEPKYDRQPIGDAMTTMLFSAIGKNAQGLRIKQDAKDRLRDIEHVRPHVKGIRYLQNVIKDFPESRQEISESIKRIATNFKKLDYYKDWDREHDRWLRTDEADIVELLLTAVEYLGTNLPAGLMEKFAGLGHDTRFRDFADKMLRSPLGLGMRYCVLGHTHEAVHVPLFVDAGVERHYLNTGTFRVNLGETEDKKDYLRFQRMSFAIIYGPGEMDDETDYPMYELWSGLRMA